MKPSAVRRVFGLSSLVAAVLCNAAFAQGLNWGQYGSAPAFGNASTATAQSFIASVPGSGRGSGLATLSLGVSGGSNAWNGFGVARNDDGYYPGPDMPQAGVTFVNGGPGYFGGMPALAAVAFATGYNVAGGPVGLPAPPSDRAALYFDAADGTTTTAQWDFSTLAGGSLPAGSWIFLDGVDQGERLVLTGPSGWIASVHAGDSSLPRPPQPLLPVMVSAPTFPVCTPGISQTATTLQLDGRYGDISTLTPTCSTVPVPVVAQTVGYTKGVDAVGVWIRTGIDVVNLSMTAIDTDPTTSNGIGGYTGPDNNYFLGVGFVSLTGPAPNIPSLTPKALAGLALLLGLVAWFALRRTRPSIAQ